MLLEYIQGLEVRPGKALHHSSLESETELIQ